MIVKIENNIVTVESVFGFPPGKYKIEDFSAEELLEERQILATFRNAHQSDCALLRALDDQLARLIDQKCNEKGKP